eukprot:scaffold2175_cov381-Prasinococcus_capsulatus_cf.AAC.6
MAHVAAAPLRVVHLLHRPLQVVREEGRGGPLPHVARRLVQAEAVGLVAPRGRGPQPAVLREGTRCERPRSGAPRRAPPRPAPLRSARAAPPPWGRRGRSPERGGRPARAHTAGRGREAAPSAGVGSGSATHARTQRARTGTTSRAARRRQGGRPGRALPARAAYSHSCSEGRRLPAQRQKAAASFQEMCTAGWSPRRLTLVAGPSGCAQSAPCTGSHQGLAATCEVMLAASPGSSSRSYTKDHPYRSASVRWPVCAANAAKASLVTCARARARASVSVSAREREARDRCRPHLRGVDGEGVHVHHAGRALHVFGIGALRGAEGEAAALQEHLRPRRRPLALRAAALQLLAPLDGLLRCSRSGPGLAPRGAGARARGLVLAVAIGRGPRAAAAARNEQPRQQQAGERQPAHPPPSQHRSRLTDARAGRRRSSSHAAACAPAAQRHEPLSRHAVGGQQDVPAVGAITCDGVTPPSCRMRQAAPRRRGSSPLSCQPRRHATCPPRGNGTPVTLVGSCCSSVGRGGRDWLLARWRLGEHRAVAVTITIGRWC